MNKVMTKPNLEKELKEALKYMEAYAELQQEEQELKDSISERLEKIKTSKEAAAKELEGFAKKNKKSFDPAGNFVLGPGYLKWADKTEVVYGKDFSMKKFAAKFLGYVNFTPRVADLKKAFVDADMRKKFDGFDIDLKVKQEFKIIIKEEA